MTETAQTTPFDATPALYLRRHPEISATPSASSCRGLTRASRADVSRGIACCGTHGRLRSEDRGAQPAGAAASGPPGPIANWASCRSRRHVGPGTKRPAARTSVSGVAGRIAEARRARSRASCHRRDAMTARLQCRGENAMAQWPRSAKTPLSSPKLREIYRN
jgi:hypothetical protein